MPNNKRWLWLLLLLPFVVGVGLWLKRSLPANLLTQTKPAVPKIEFRAPHASVTLATTPTTQQAFALILQELGYEQTWHFFQLPHELNPASLEPYSIVLEFLPINQYQSQLHPFLVERAVDEQGNLVSGASCRYQSNNNQLKCFIFSAYDFNQTKPDQFEPARFITNATVKTLLLLSGQIGEVRAQELGFTRLNQRIQQALEQKQYQLVAVNEPEANRSQLLNPLSWLGWLKPATVFASDCTGFLECKVVEEVCTCPNGNSCVPEEDQCYTDGVYTHCSDHCVRYCSGPWEGLGAFYCEHESWDGFWCRPPYSGTCGERWAGDTSGTYCATRGNCYPVSAPPSTPPPNFTPSPTPPNFTPPPVPTEPPGHASCGCCDASDWDANTGCWERNGLSGLQCCCGTGSCQRLTDGSCVNNPVACPPQTNVYWISPVSGYVHDQNGEPVVGVEIEVTRGSSQGVWWDYESRSFWTDQNGYWSTGMNIYNEGGVWVRCEGWCFNSGDGMVPIRARVKAVPSTHDLNSAQTALSAHGVRWGGCYFDNGGATYCLNTPPEEADPKPIPHNGDYPHLDTLYYGEGISCTWVHPEAYVHQHGPHNYIWLSLPAGSKYYSCQTCDGGCRQNYNFTVRAVHPRVVSVTSSHNSICMASDQNTSLTFRASFEDETVNPTYINDIKIFQVNIENQSLGSLPNPPNPVAYNQLLWPLRLINTRGATNTLRLAHAPSGSNQQSNLLQHPTANNRFYLASDLQIPNIAKVIGSNNPDQSPTYFIVQGNFITAQWQVELLNQFPSTNPLMNNFYINGYVQDFTDLQHIHQYSTFPPPFIVNASGTNYYFHRRANLNITTPSITLAYFESNDNEFINADNICIHPSGSPSTVSLEDIPNAKLKIKSTGSVEWQEYSVSLFQEINACSNFDIQLVLDPADGYVCNCGIGFDVFTCHYTNIPASYNDANPTINFYLMPIDLNHNAWFQAVGGSIGARNGIRSNVPFVDSSYGPCIANNLCWPALITKQPWANGASNTPAFAFSRTGNIHTHKNGGVELIHYNLVEGGGPHRTQSEDGHAIHHSTFPTQFSYQFFFNRFGSESIPLTSAALPELSNQLTIFLHNGDLEINQNHNWEIESNRQVIVFINGNLLLNNTNPNENSVITSVAKGGYLAFIVSGNINISDTVGYQVPGIDPRNTFARPILGTPANVQGIFIADGTLSVLSNNNPNQSDRRFIGEGTFVGWSGVNLPRTFDDGGIGRAWHNLNPTETFIYRPDFLVNAPRVMKEPVHEWREGVPRSLGSSGN